MKLALLLIALPLLGQVQKIDAGSPTDQYFKGGVAWGGPWPNSVPADSTLRYGPSGTPFSYTIPLTPALYTLSITLIEPNATRAGQRVMQVTANGQASPSIDLWALVGPQAEYVLRSQILISAFGAYANKLELDFRGIVGNAVVSSIQIEPYAAGILFQAPITFGRECQADGYQRFFLDDQGYLMICVRKQSGNGWVRMPTPMEDVK